MLKQLQKLSKYNKKHISKCIGNILVTLELIPAYYTEQIWCVGINFNLIT